MFKLFSQRIPVNHTLLFDLVEIILQLDVSVTHKLVVDCELPKLCLEV